MADVPLIGHRHKTPGRGEPGVLCGHAVAGQVRRLEGGNQAG
jgi:hypothetical protein